MRKFSLWSPKRGLLIPVVVLGFTLLYQNCAPVKFSTESSSSLSLGSPSTPLGSDSCVPTINVTPQFNFVPSSFDAGQQFTVVIANQNLYGSIAIDFGDKSPLVTVMPSNSAPITHTYTNQGSYIISVTATDSLCRIALNGSQGVAVSPCVPTAATVQTSVTPSVPKPPPVGNFTTQADITNSADFTNASWTLNGIPQTGGADITLDLVPGSYTLQAQALDSCGTGRAGPITPICVASRGNPVVTVLPSSFTAGTSNIFTITNPGNYQSLNIDFGDGNTSVIPTTGQGAGVISHTYAIAQNYTYIVTAVDSCGAGRSTSTPITVSGAACTVTQADGCSGNEFCTGRTSCNTQGNCSTSCNQCGFTGVTVDPITSCNGSQQCVSGGTSCNPTNTCNSVCGQCGFAGTPVTPVTTCTNGQVCVSGGTSCDPTQTCTAIPGQCGDPLPTPIPTPTPKPSPTPIPVATAQPTPRPTPTPVPQSCMFCHGEAAAAASCKPASYVGTTQGCSGPNAEIQVPNAVCGGCP